MSGFKSKFLQRVRFCFEIFCKKSDFARKCAFEKSRFDWIYPVKWMNFANFVHFQKSTILTRKTIFEKQVFQQKIYNLSDFDIKILKRVRF